MRGGGDGAGACLAAALSAQPFDGSEIFDGRSGEEGQIGLAARREEASGMSGC